MFCAKKFWVWKGGKGMGDGCWNWAGWWAVLGVVGWERWGRKGGSWVDMRG